MGRVETLWGIISSRSPILSSIYSLHRNFMRRNPERQKNGWNNTHKNVVNSNLWNKGGWGGGGRGDRTNFTLSTLVN